MLLLLAACSLTVGGTLSVAYMSSVRTASNASRPPPTQPAPSATATAIGRSTAYDTGFIALGSICYVYANVSDTGNPASGIASVAANVSSITSGSTAVALTAGSYSGGGTAYSYCSAALTVPAVLTAGTHSYTITSTDMATNLGTQSFNTVVDNTAPTAVDVIPLGQVNLNAIGYLTTGTGTFVTYGANGSPVPSTITRSGARITVSLGTASASVSTSSTAARMTWAPSTSATDIAGNANTTAIATQSGTVHINS